MKQVPKQFLVVWIIADNKTGNALTSRLVERSSDLFSDLVVAVLNAAYLVNDETRLEYTDAIAAWAVKVSPGDTLRLTLHDVLIVCLPAGKSSSASLHQRQKTIVEVRPDSDESEQPAEVEEEEYPPLFPPKRGRRSSKLRP